MNIQTYIDNFDDLTPTRKITFITDVLSDLMDKDELGDPDARYALNEIFMVLQDLEADDYFGTEGYKG